ncbi:hypothetical protein [Aurantiacibacter spongiae]|uniref:LysR family transcriptional regulator n=1 Tax=Aurantiacibacter spongiae TaxID=2488860 RepID=A0A3N5DMS2_9SPHN|nr:hypothetical protein [Aurantiacibacter spongiae]RPF72195.1 hypothetical protein EG799_11620 [Aurantiacibacter spongiae]
MSMTASAPGASSAARDNSRWTGVKAAAFLRHLALGGNATRAAAAVGMSRKSAYSLRARAPQFAQAWEVALHDWRQMREVARLRRRVVHPVLDRRPRASCRGEERSGRPGDGSGREG